MPELNVDHDAAVQAILAAHQTTLGLPGAPFVNAADPANPSLGPIGRAVYAACEQMGFLPAEANVLAQAWQRQTQRLGHFDARAWPSAAHDFGIAPWPRHDAFASCPQQLGLYAVLPDAAWVGRMARAGVPTVQLRFKSDDAAAVAREIKQAVAAVKDSGALLFINDHWQAAIDAGAYGVHLGQEDLDTADLAALRRAGLRVGLSTHGYAEMLRADAHSPSYIAMGAVFPTTLKRMQTAPQGTGRLNAYAQLMRQYPLVAIGGIDAQNLPAVMASGVGSIAVVRALVADGQPEKTAAHLQQQIQRLQAAPPLPEESQSRAAEDAQNRAII